MEIFPAGTVIPLKASEAGMAVLLLKRNPALVFHGGAWVFPGGRIEQADYDAAMPGDEMDAARHAAVREAREEAGIRLFPADLVPIFRWTTPPGMARRFRAWFFAAPAGADRVTIDGGEIHDYRWISPHDALRLSARGTIRLPVPTAVSLKKLTSYHSPKAALEGLNRSQPALFEP